MLIPYDHYKDKPERKLGVLKDVGGFRIKKDFKISDDEFLSLWNIFLIRISFYGLFLNLKIKQIFYSDYYIPG